MPLTLNVGLTKKVGLPDYGSLGASCHLQVELDGGLLSHDLDGFQQQVRRAYTSCRQAVLDELARQQSGRDPADDEAAHASTTSRTRSAARSNGRETSNGRAAINGHATANGRSGSRSASGHAGDGHASNIHRASTKQLDYARQLADQIDGLGVRKLGTLTSKLYEKPLADLSSLEASGLIDVLKDLKSGELSLDDALAGAAV